MNMNTKKPTPHDSQIKKNKKIPKLPAPRFMKRRDLMTSFSLIAFALIIKSSVGLIPSSSDTTSTEAHEDSSSKHNICVVKSSNSDNSVGNFPFEPNLPHFSSKILSRYSKCSFLANDIEEAGKYLANLIIHKYEKMPEDPPVYTSRPFTSRPVMAPVAAPRTTPDSAAPETSSSYESNNQVEDVEEADIVKSDGTNVFLAYGNDLVWMLITGEVVSRFSIPEMKDKFPKISHWDNDNRRQSQHHGGYYPPPYSYQSISGLLLNEDKNELVVIVSYRSTHDDFVFIGDSMTASHVYSIVSDKKNKLILKSSYVHKGRYETSRLINNHAHIVTVIDINNRALDELLYRYQFPKMSDDEYVQKAYDLAAKMLPKYAKQLLKELVSEPDGTIKLITCKRIFKLSDMVGMASDLDNDPTGGRGLLNAFVSTTSFKTSNHLPFTSGAFLPTSSLDAYANKDYLVVAGKGWLLDVKTLTYVDRTYLLQFQVRGSGSSTKPVAIGQVPGYLLNQFSIDEHDGYLRVATTISAAWGFVGNKWKQLSPSSSQIAVLKQKKGILTEMAVVTDLGIGEDIFSVRFFRDKGFVVTFERIDPFFTIDLSDPKKPFVAGELKISGFSNYLHLIEDDQYVLTVGQDADEKTGQQTGLQISLFDVRDFANPKQIHKTVIKGWSSSDAQHDHLSFRYFSNTLILPVEIHNSNQSYDGFYVFNISIKNGITAQGKVSHATNSREMLRGCWSSSYVDSRSMVFEGKLMTMKGHTVLMSDGLVKPKKIWKLNLDEDLQDGKYDYYKCVPWFGFWW